MIQSEELIGNNLYAYCANNPINNADPSGHSWFNIVKNVVTHIVNSVVNTVKTISTMVNQYNAYSNWVNAPTQKTAANIASNSVMTSIKADAKNGTTKSASDYSKQYEMMYGASYRALNITYVSSVSIVRPTFNVNQQAVIDLAKQARKSGGISMQNARTLEAWGIEYGVPNTHLDLNPIKGKTWSGVPHININHDHIRILP